MESKQNFPISLRVFLVISAGWYLVLAVWGEQYFVGPFLGWITTGFITLLWIGAGRPVPVLPARTVRTWALILLYGIFHTYILTGSAFGWRYVALHASLFLWAGFILTGLIGQWRMTPLPVSIVLWGLLVAVFIPLVVLLVHHYPFSTRVNWGFLALFCAVSAGFLLSRVESRRRYLGWGVILLSGLNIVVARSRAAILFLMLAGALGLFRFMGKRRRRVYAMVVVAIFILIGSGVIWWWTQRQGPLGTARLDIWKADLRLILNHPLGVGFGQVTQWLPRVSPPRLMQGVYYAKTLEHPHQQFLGLVIEFGWPIVLLLCLLIREIFMRLVKLESGIRRILKAGFGAFVLWGMVHDVFAYQFLSGLLLLMLALMYGTDREVKIRTGHRTLVLVGVVFMLSAAPMVVSLALTGMATQQLRTNPRVAADTATRAITWWKGNAWAYHRRADAREAGQKHPDDAVLRDRLFAVVYHPGERRFLSALVQAWISRCRDSGERFACETARFWLRSYLKWVPHDVIARWSLFQLERFADPSAEQILDTILRYEPNFARVRYVRDRLACANRLNLSQCRPDAEYYQQIRNLFLGLPPGSSPYVRYVLAIPPVWTPLDSNEWSTPDQSNGE